MALHVCRLSTGIMSDLTLILDLLSISAWRWIKFHDTSAKHGSVFSVCQINTKKKNPILTTNTK